MRSGANYRSSGDPAVRISATIVTAVGTVTCNGSAGLASRLSGSSHQVHRYLRHCFVCSNSAPEGDRNPDVAWSESPLDHYDINETVLIAMVVEGIWGLASGVVIGGLFADRPVYASPFDPLVIATVSLIVAITAGLAAIFPGWRALHTDVLTTLRCEWL